MKNGLLAQLQVFLSVARLKSFSAAARESGASRAAVSQAVRQLEDHLQVVLLTRTTRSVALTDAGRRLFEEAGPGLGQAMAALHHVKAQPGEVAGRLRLTAPHMAVPFVFTTVLPTFRARHPRVEVEVVVEDRFVDIVADGYDAGVRLSESIERDMVQVRLTDAFRFVVVGAPAYFKRHGVPRRPEDLLRHDCVTFRAQSTGALYAWELEKGRRAWRVPVRGGVVTNDSDLMRAMALAGTSLVYAFEPEVKDLLKRGRLQLALEDYAAQVPGFFLYFAKHAQRAPALRLFIDTARELAVRTRPG